MQKRRRQRQRSASFCPPWSLCRAPDVLRQFYHELELGFLHLGADRVAGVDAGEAALRTDRKAVDIDETARLLVPPLERGLRFQRVGLGRNEAEDDGLLLRDETQRRKVAGAR